MNTIDTFPGTLSRDAVTGSNALLARIFALFPALGLLMTIKGGFVGMTWERPCKMRAANRHLNIVKTVSAVGRVGINHENRAAVQAARESGELPAENTGLPWGSWVLFPYFIAHRDNLYVRLYPVENSIPRAVFTMDGKRVNKADIVALMLASESEELDGAIGCMTLNIANLKQVRYGENIVDVSAIAISSEA